jgi:hypothetical protein
MSLSPQLTKEKVYGPLEQEVEYNRTGLKSGQTSHTL